jgi:hypothetical protein
MKKMLIGVSAYNNSTTRAAIATLAEEFCIEHISMRQPLINMIATLTAMDPAHQEFSCTPNLIVEHLGITIGELEVALGLNLRTIKPDFFIQCTRETIGISNAGLNGELFSGHLISGLKTELEAQWIRDQGGLVIHLYQYDNTADFHALNEMDCDLVINIGNNPTRNNLVASIAAIKGHLCAIKQAA